MSRPSARDRLIVALDVRDVASARALVERLGDAATFYKVGLELAYAPGGLGLVEEIVGRGAHVFLDLKLHDIPTTVERAAAQVARLGVSLLTVHAYPQTMRAARAALAGTATRLLAVTVMTSYDDDDLEEAGYREGVVDLVARRASQAMACGIDGLILSAHEVAAVRAAHPDLLLVTPGVRPASSPTFDQKRVMTPGDAIRAGADRLVVGRPVTGAPDPAVAARAIVAEIEARA